MLWYWVCSPTWCEGIRELYNIVVHPYSCSIMSSPTRADSCCLLNRWWLLFSDMSWIIVLLLSVSDQFWQRLFKLLSRLINCFNVISVHTFANRFSERLITWFSCISSSCTRWISSIACGWRIRQLSRVIHSVSPWNHHSRCWKIKGQFPVFLPTTKINNIATTCWCSLSKIRKNETTCNMVSLAIVMLLTNQDFVMTP